jgi:hypothetical protein
MGALVYARAPPALISVQLVAGRVFFLRTSPLRRFVRNRGALRMLMHSQGYRVLLNLQHLAPTPAPVPRLSAGASGGSTSADSTTAFTTHFAYESAAAARDDRVWVAQAPEEDYEMHALRPCTDA